MFNKLANIKNVNKDILSFQEELQLFEKSILVVKLYLEKVLSVCFYCRWNVFYIFLIFCFIGLSIAHCHRNHNTINE